MAKVPTSLEMRVCLGLVGRFCGLNQRALSFRLGISRQWFSNIITKPVSIRAATARDIREKTEEVIKTEFDPFYCPFPGAEREWFDLCQSARSFLGKVLEETVPKPEEHLSLTKKRRRRFVE